MPRNILKTGVREHVGPSGRAKLAFKTKAEATAYAKKLQEAPSASKRRPYGAYCCTMCHAWHVGRRAPKGTDRRRLEIASEEGNTNG